VGLTGSRRITTVAKTVAPVSAITIHGEVLRVAVTSSSRRHHHAWDGLGLLSVLYQTSFNIRALMKSREVGDVHKPFRLFMVRLFMGET
jgi:hypothetical protein